ncbi:hypothetical protein [Methanimicrococcus hongohii]|uniref:hypothetical protein n=1 Tax=Methanimicrococcus hongohii TaxID=3028295 RepID=UPI00292DBB61|nr:hypothetical protein [Methanimicrococcus sp. Hf6]
MAGTSTVVAEESVSPLNYPETDKNIEYIYISGLNVMYSANFNSNLSVYYGPTNGSYYNAGGSSTYLSTVNFDAGQPVIFDFPENRQLSDNELETYVLRVAGSGRYLTLCVDEILLPTDLDAGTESSGTESSGTESSGTESEDIPEQSVKVIYPVYSDRPSPSASYFTYLPEFYTAFDADIMENLAGSDVVYVFEDEQLRYIYWFDNSLLQSNSETMAESGVFDFEFLVNMSEIEIEEANINVLFICPDHLPSYVGSYTSKDIPNNPDIESCEIHWNLKLNESQITDADTELYLNFAEDSHSHIVSFTDVALLENDLSKSRTVALKFYAGYRNALSDGSYEDISYEDISIPFKFSREYQSVQIKPVLDEDTGTFTVEIDDDTTSSLSSLSFPESVSAVLEGASLIIEPVSRSVLNEIESDELDETTNIYSIFSINFENNGENIKSELNNALTENDANVLLTFEIPKTDEIILDNDNLVVFHITDAEDGIDFEILKPSVEEIGDHYSITVSTSSFSTFAIASLESDKPVEPIPTPVSKSESYGQATLIPERIETEENSGYEGNITPNIPTITDIITAVQGYMSVFSVLVVLTSGLFMWDYIRRRI